MKHQRKSIPTPISINSLVQPKNLPIVIPKDLKVASMLHNLSIFKKTREDDSSAHIEKLII